VSFKIIMMTSVTRSCFTKQHQNCKTKIKTTVCKTKTKTTACKTKTKIKTDFFLVSDRSCPKADGLRPHHCNFVTSAALAEYALY